MALSTDEWYNLCTSMGERARPIISSTRKDNKPTERQLLEQILEELKKLRPTETVEKLQE